MVRTGEPVLGFFLIQSGKARVYRSSEAGQEISLSVLEAGSIFGDGDLFGAKEHEESAFILEDLEAFFIPKHSFLELIPKDPQLGLQVMRSLCAKLQGLSKSFEIRELLDSRERVEDYLIQMKNKNPFLKSLQLPLSKKEIAAQLGMSPETFSRVLTRLEEEGSILVDRRNIEILDESKFQFFHRI